MRTRMFISVLVAIGIVLGQSVPQGADAANKTNVSEPTIRGKNKSPENCKVCVAAFEKRQHLSPGLGQMPLRSENSYLKDIAYALSLSVSEEETPGDIAFKIKRKIGCTTRYRGEVFSDESFAKTKSSIRIPADAEVFAEYHKFIRDIAGKRVLILDAVTE